MTSTCELLVASTWDGRPVAAQEQVRLRLRLTPRHLRIVVSAPFHDDAPPPGEPGATDRLWEHEVVELFVAGAGNDDPNADDLRVDDRGDDAPFAGEAASRERVDSDVPYTEVELSPWGHHLVLRLRGVRKVIASGLPLHFRSCRRGARWLGAARLHRELLPAPPWRANAFAIHGDGADRRFLAATPLPGERPDFHQPHRFPALPLLAKG